MFFVVENYETLADDAAGSDDDYVDFGAEYVVFNFIYETTIVIKYFQKHAHNTKLKLHI